MDFADPALNPFYYDAKIKGRPRLASCWQGRLHGILFTLSGYSDAEGFAGVAVQSGGRIRLVPIGVGQPAVSRFTGQTVCYLPNPAKGIPTAINLPSGRSIADPLVANRLCPAEDVFGRAPRVQGIRPRVDYGQGVLRTFP